MKHTILSIVVMSIAWTAKAQTQLPVITPPQELVTGEFSEGVVTRLTSAEIQELLPWAQNAKSKISDGVKLINTLPLRERLPELVHVIESVVRNSQGKRYQMFMRFALNRGLLLVSELQRFASLEDISVSENAIDILLRASQVALLHYESDLSFQTRMQKGEALSEHSYQDFAAHFYAQMSAGILNILNLEAQYRLQNLLVEMTIWDLSRDEHAPAYADIIIEAHETLQRLPSHPDRDTRVNLKNIRRLFGLKLGQQWVHEIIEPNIEGVYFNILSSQESVCRALGYTTSLEIPVTAASPIGPRYADGHGRHEPHVYLDDKMQVKQRIYQWFSHYKTLGKVRCVNKKNLDADKYEVGHKLKHYHLPTEVVSGNIYYFDNNAIPDGICKYLGHKGAIEGTVRSRSDRVPGRFSFHIHVNANGEIIRRSNLSTSDSNTLGQITCYE